jgi:hypothetical protein
MTQIREPRKAASRRSCEPKCLQGSPEFFAGELIQRAKGLIQQQQLRIMHQRPAQIGPLQHSARQLPGKMIGETAEANLRQQVADPIPKLALALAPIFRPERLHDLERQHHISFDGKPRHHAGVLKRHSDPQRLDADLPAADHDDAAGRANETADQPQDCRFAAA